MRRLVQASLALTALLVSVPLASQDAPPARRVSLTLSPLHLLDPQLHVTGEVRLASRWSASATLAGGTVSEEQQSYRLREIGGQVRFYVLGTFQHGLMVGADVGHVDANGQPDGAMELLIGTRVGGFLGYKRILGRGVTAIVQLGPVHVRGHGGATEWQTLHTLGVGWSW